MRLRYIGRSAKRDGQVTLRPLVSGSEPTGRRTAAEWAKQAAFTGLLFALFAEWFYPLKRLGPHIDLHDIRPFLGAIAIFLAVGLIVRSRTLSIALRSVTAIAVTAWMFGAASLHYAAAGDGGLLGALRESVAAGVSMLGSALAADAERWMAGEWLRTSGEVRTLLLLAGWAMLTASIQAQMLTRRTVLFFSVATICYLFGFQWGYGLEVTEAVIRAAGWGLLLSACLHLDRRLAEDTERSKTPGIRPVRWLGQAALVTLLIVGIGFGLSRMPDWTPPESLPSLREWTQSLAVSANEWGAARSAAENASLRGTTIGTTGYSTDDTELGGALRDDPRILFTAESPEPTYWRGESKSRYTGRGWASADTAQEETVDGSGRLQLPDSPVSGWSEPLTQTVRWQAYVPHLPLVLGGRPERLVSWMPDGETEAPPQGGRRCATTRQANGMPLARVRQPEHGSPINMRLACSGPMRRCCGTCRSCRLKRGRDGARSFSSRLNSRSGCGSSAIGWPKDRRGRMRPCAACSHFCSRNTPIPKAIPKCRRRAGTSWIIFCSRRDRAIAITSRARWRFCCAPRAFRRAG